MSTIISFDQAIELCESLHVNDRAAFVAWATDHVNNGLGEFEILQFRPNTIMVFAIDNQNSGKYYELHGYPEYNGPRYLKVNKQNKQNKLAAFVQSSKIC